MNILKLPGLKQRQEKIVMITCYDYTSARIIQQSEIDMILVGDSAAMVMHGHNTTLPIDADMMAMHVAAVRRGAPDKFIIGDMPFLSFRKSLSDLSGLMWTTKEGAATVESLRREITASIENMDKKIASLSANRIEATESMRKAFDARISTLELGYANIQGRIWSVSAFFASRSMSSRRSLSGGMRIGTTLIR